MTDPALITMDADGTVREYDEVPAALASMLLNDHAQHAGIFFVPECADCQMDA